VVGEEGLMAGDEDIGKGEEAGELVVLENLRGAVFKEEARLLFVDIDGQVADVTLFEATDDSGGIEDGPAAGVDQEDPFFHLGEGVVVDEVKGGGKEGDVKGEDVGFPEKFFLRDVAAEVGEFRMGLGVESQDSTPEAGEVFDDFAADGPGAVYADGLIANFEALETFQLEVTFPDALVGAGDLASHGQKQGEGEFGYGVGGVGRHRGHGDAELFGGSEVDMVGAGAEGGDELGATLGENFEAGAVDLVVHEDQGGPVTSAEGGGGGVELGFEEFEMVATGSVFSLESGFGIGAGAKNQRLHVVSLRLSSPKGEALVLEDRS